MSNIEEQSTKGRRDRLRELAGMLQEKGEGTIKDLRKIKGQFILKTGVRKITVDEYLEVLEDAGILIKTLGSRRWRYVKENEVDDLWF